MYLATTRYLVTKKARQLNTRNKRLFNYSAVEPLNPTKYLLVPGTLRFDQHQVTYKVSATGFRSHDSFGSPYSVSTACLGPFIDGRHWFAETEDPRKTLDEAEKHLKKEDKAAFDLNIEPDSLEDARKRIKEQNVKDPDIPVGWTRKT